jgi:hypothetical protein
MIGPPDCELAVARGRPPQGKKSYEMPWAILRRLGAEPLASQFACVLEAYQGERRVERVEPIAFSVTPHGSFEPVGIRVFSGPFVDTILLHDDSQTPYETADGVTSDAEYVFMREKEGQCVVAIACGGTHLRKDKRVFTLPEMYRGTIVSCDWANNALYVEPLPAAWDELPGRHIQIVNPYGNHSSYLIEAVEPVGNQCRIMLPHNPRIGEGLVAECSDGCVRTSTPLRFYSYWNYYAGKTLANETGSVAYPLSNVTSGGNCRLEPGSAADLRGKSLQQQFADLDGNGRPQLVIYDYGPGDQVLVKRPATLTQ